MFNGVPMSSDMLDEAVEEKAIAQQNQPEEKKKVAKKKSKEPIEIIESPMPGSIMNISVKEGDKVEKGQVVLILEAMKMENDIVVESSGTVSKVLVEVGTSVQAGAPLIEIV